MPRWRSRNPYNVGARSVSLLYGALPIFSARLSHWIGSPCREGAMLYRPPYEHPLDRLEHQLRQARSVTSDLASQMIAQACVRFAVQSPGAKAKVDRLIASRAWTDAAFALLALELQQWSVRRLIRADCEWLCSLSRTPALPPDLDETV